MTKPIAERHFNATRLELRAASTDGTAPLPKGVCGQLVGVALTYNTPDDYGTVFLPGCLTRTINEKVNQGKVKLFADHGPFTATHVGVVRKIENVGDTAVMTADLFDTDAGRTMKEYLEAVIASGADTGLSIGFKPRDSEWRKTPDGKDTCLYFKEVELRETSITPVPAVPGADVMSVRHEGGEDPDQPLLMKKTLEHILRSLPQSDAEDVFKRVYPATSAAKTDTPAAISEDTPPVTGTAENAGTAEIATAEARIRAIAAASALL